MPEVRGNQNDKVFKIDPDLCWCEWRAGLPCPNSYTHVIENTVSPGYMKCCEQHKDGFMRLGPWGVKVWTRDEWEVSSQEAVIKSMILKPMKTHGTGEKHGR